MVLTSDPVSTRKRVCALRSCTKNRRLREGPETPVAASVWPQEEDSVGKDSEGDGAWRYCDGKIEFSALQQGQPGV